MDGRIHPDGWAWPYAVEHANGQRRIGVRLKPRDRDLKARALAGFHAVTRDFKRVTRRFRGCLWNLGLCLLQGLLSRFLRSLCVRRFAVLVVVSLQRVSFCLRHLVSLVLHDVSRGAR